MSKASQSHSEKEHKGNAAVLVGETGKLRIDKWLWAARFFKTRSLAAEAAEAGRALVNGARAKPAKAIAVGDRLDIRIGQYRFEIEVLALSGKRGGAPEAQKLYRESDASRTAREELSARLKAMPQPAFKGRPTKRDRRKIENVKVEVKNGSVWG
ncbi:MAG: ribosome-associated heat shock protein Hsp15 [Gallionellaceae bacterium]|nr:MAG: ribosome-associated heat shock protein Hsp15 [Gallionellaceae bacterium]